MAYQDLPRFAPNYGNRYGFRQKYSPATVPSTQAPPGSPLASATETRMNDYSGTSAEDQGQAIDQGNPNQGESNDNNDNYATDVRNQATMGLGYEHGKATPAQMLGGIAGVFGPPGLSSLVDFAADKTGWGSGGIHPTEQYGAVGTADIASGGVFGADQRAYDPITGRGLNSYANKDAFKSGSYVQGIMDNPFSLDSYLSDPDNAYDYQSFDPTNPTSLSSQKGLQSQGFQFAMDKGMYAADEELGTLPTQAEKDLVAQHVGQTEYGFEEHTVAPDTATNQAIQGIGYSDSGAATPGSQFSSTGTFASSHSDNNNNDSNDNDFSYSGTSSGGAANAAYADDAGASDSGGGGGK